MHYISPWYVPASTSLSRASAVYFFWGEDGLHDNPSTAPIINSELQNKSLVQSEIEFTYSSCC